MTMRACLYLHPLRFRASKHLPYRERCVLNTLLPAWKSNAVSPTDEHSVFYLKYLSCLDNFYGNIRGARARSNSEINVPIFNRPDKVICIVNLQVHSSLDSSDHFLLYSWVHLTVRWCQCPAHQKLPLQTISIAAQQSGRVLMLVVSCCSKSCAAFSCQSCHSNNLRRILFLLTVCQLGNAKCLSILLG